MIAVKHLEFHTVDSALHSRSQRLTSSTWAAFVRVSIVWAKGRPTPSPAALLRTAVMQAKGRDCGGPAGQNRCVDLKDCSRRSVSKMPPAATVRVMLRLPEARSREPFVAPKQRERQRITGRFVEASLRGRAAQFGVTTDELERGRY